MSTTYLIYTEIKLKDKWICVCPYVYNEKGEKRMITTYESGSRSYFGATYDKLREINVGIKYPEGLSDVLKKHFYDDVIENAKKNPNYDSIDNTIDYYRNVIVCVPLQALKEELPSANGLKYQYHGIYHKDSIYAYEMGEADWLEPVDHKKYAKLTNEEKQAYMYYEYDDNMDWPYYFKILIERVNIQVSQYIDATANWGEEPEVRIIGFAL